MHRLSILLRLVIVASFIAGVGLIAAPSISAQDTTFVEGDEVGVVGGDLNLREAPGFEANVVVVLESGASLSILDGPVEADDTFWYQVLADAATVGWVSDEFIESAATEVVESVIGEEVLVVLGPLNMRETPGLDSTVVGTLESDAVATIIAEPQTVDEIDWYQVETVDGTTGWIASDYVQIVASAPDQYAFITGGALNVRSDASIDAEIAATLDEGSVVLLLEETSEADEIIWRMISSGEEDDVIEGWVDSEFLSDPLTMEEDAEVLDGPLNLRGSASIEAEILETLETGTVVTLSGGPLIEDDIVWFEVISGEQTGFVAGEFLGQTEAEEEA